ncbi:hypothetical protein P4S83_17715 [Aneurinibacillus thermoaerophilus]|uniref:phage tail assembly chaperone n=1 Tax=Aneurinibacillus thermoaerophilus TaxID=143495 RepID=UPI002E1E863C|nr:hypothetical protein [Aneurinibacillus thermoaerophilus]MED0765542.1 hypothetical protein [Aneurinibacillus thermoaerophilus]
MTENQTIEFISLEDILNEDLSAVSTEIPVQLINGKYTKLKIKSITQEQEAKIRKRCTRYEGGKRGMKTPVINDELYNPLIIAAATEVDWGMFAEKVGATVPAPEFIIPKVLSIGGIVHAVQEIQRISGLDEDMDELVKAAKN